MFKEMDYHFKELSMLKDSEVQDFFQSFRWDFISHQVIIQGMYMMFTPSKTAKADCKIIKQAYPIGNEIFVSSGKSANIRFKMTTLHEFIKLVRKPHEKLLILYTQRMAKKSKAFKKKLDRFEWQMEDYKDFKWDDRVCKFEYHTAFYFYYFLKIRFMTTFDGRDAFTNSEEDYAIKKNLVMIELLTRFKSIPITINKD